MVNPIKQGVGLVMTDLFQAQRKGNKPSDSKVGPALLGELGEVVFLLTMFFVFVLPTCRHTHILISALVWG
jgi:hypothetical protein